ncbi:DUF362 domain-containing protein [bacterium]|nr:DUF362 domain-containing protein [bacterium]MBU1065649.1 DUF362 domain-containing protein [bacterium]MBU1634877.1 DUF362 domain-containing protein [bacterium]MBU1874394.1 DUF362 domain-containing protein [bacterium]
MDRRKFLKTAAFIAGAGLVARKPGFAAESSPTVAIIKNGLPQEMAAKAFEMLGGVSQFISRDDYVMVKPNMSWDRRPEYAATTNPELVSAVVTLCLEAGAKKVLIVDNTCNDARRSYKNCQIQDMAGKAGADVRFVRDSHFIETEIPSGTSMKKWPIHEEVFKVDKLINMPILKHHSLPGLTIGFKNMMGLVGGNRGQIHRPFAERIVDLNRVIVADLTIVDAIRVLRRNGPSGGNLKDVDELNTVIAGTDRVLVDAWSARVFGTEPESLEYLKLAHTAGMGEIDTNKYPAKHYTFNA